MFSAEKATKSRLLFNASLLFAGMLLCSAPMSAATWFVNDNASGANTGTSWTDAFTDLQSALAAAGYGDQIWVAAGTYKPTGGTDRTISFAMKNNLAIYGGFSGTETMLSQRNWVANPCILSGDIGTVGVNTDNSYHVISNSGLNSTAVLDGFTISEGNANSSSFPNNLGGGMYNSSSSPTLTNCNFSSNSAGYGGGGLDNRFSSSPTLTNCSFLGNSAGFDGGGMYNSSSSPTLTNCSFLGNSAGIDGGGMYNYYSSPTLTNCSFSGNSANYNGGGIDNYYYSSPTLTNCSFSGNSAANGGGIDNYYYSSPTLKNCILWGNSSEMYNQTSMPTISNSIVRGGCPGGATCTNVQNVDPIFVMQPPFSSAPTTAGDLHLTHCSPALDAGNDADNATTTDLDGNARKFEAIAGGQMIDMGAYEFQSTSASLACYKDNDNDGFGDPATMIYSCSTCPAGYVSDNNDCDDNNNAVFPGATEICNNIDDDCDNLIDTADPDLVDNTPPTISCKPHTVVLDASGQASITPADVFQSGDDNCGGIVTPFFVTPSSFNCSNIGTNAVTLSVQDERMNVATCTATITVQDFTLPTVVCKNHTAVLSASGQASITPADVFQSGDDNCGTVNLQSVSPNSFSCANIGNNVVTLIVNDSNGNTNTCTAYVTVQDLTTPSAQCQSEPISVSLAADGFFSLTPAMIDDGSFNACGIATMSVAPAQLSCDNIGQNTVTLTVTDVNGGTATCTATVNVAAFLSIVTIAVTNETCAGASNGSIVITATVPTGNNLLYSIGGVWFQSSNTFSNLTPGTYSIVVLAEGTNGCQATASVTVEPGSASQIWYQDADGDAYTSGQTIQACTQPVGYIASPLGMDCNDNDPAVQTPVLYYLDNDGDGFGSSTTASFCTPVAPSGYATASGDCDDNNNAIHPNAAEICNGLDDNCNGQTDEGISGDTYVGNVTFANQAQVNAWLPCYSVIQGNLTIQGVGVNNLGPLANLVQVTGNVTISATGLSNLSGLGGLATIGSSLSIMGNLSLTDIAVLTNLMSVGGNLTVSFNSNLSLCCGIHHLVDADPDNGWVTGNKIVMLNKMGGNCTGIPIILNTCVQQSLLAPPVGGNAPTTLPDTRKMALFPNPASGEVTVTLSGSYQSGTLRVYDAMGRLISGRELEPHSQQERIELSTWAPGVYLVQVQLDGEVLAQRLVVE